MSDEQVSTISFLVTGLRQLAVWGPGLLVMLADTDAGNVVTAAQSGAQWGYRLLPLLLVLIPLLYMVQELTVRLGIFTGQGYGELIRARFGSGWAWLVAIGLVVATIGSLVTEFTGIAGVGELYGVSRNVTLPAASAVLLAVVLTGSYRRTERAALIIGSFELVFFAAAWAAHPDAAIMLRQSTAIPWANHGFKFLAAALIGAVFNPWMIFYQQSAVADKKLRAEDYGAARWGTAIGAVLTQALTAAVLVAAAATLSSKADGGSLDSIGAISAAFAPVLGSEAGRLVFGMGVLGASMVAAVVSSLAMAWGLGEIAGFQRSFEIRARQAPWFYGVYIVGAVASALLVWRARDLVWLNVDVQVINALMLPLVIGLLLVLATRVLPEPYRLRGTALWVVVSASALTCVLGLWGGLAGL